jgi:hypothetical protein
MGSPTLPPPRPVLWPLRPPESADVWTVTESGRTVVTIDHSPLAGVTPEMLTWWYGHVPGSMNYAGKTYPRYLVWHPLDHIDYQIERPGMSGPVSVGTRLHITEALGRDLDKLVDIHVMVEEIGDRRAVITKQIFGTTVVRLENEFSRIPGGSRYVTRMIVGDHTPLARLFLNRIAHGRAFPPPKLQRWARHHIEEIGNLENFLPDLFRYRAAHEP